MLAQITATLRSIRLLMSKRCALHGMASLGISLIITAYRGIVMTAAILTLTADMHMTTIQVLAGQAIASSDG